MNSYSFTGRVRKVLALARQESERLRHEYVGTEHILLGLVREGEGVGAAVIQNLDVQLDDLRDMVFEIVKPGKESRFGPGSDIPYTSRAKKVIELAMAEARDLNHNYVGTEHLLMGLIREENGLAAQVLTHWGLKLDNVHAETARLLGTETQDRLSLSFTAEVKSQYPPELDALVAAADNHRLLMENDYVRVLETTIDPGAITPMHTHRWPAAHYVLGWSHFVRRDETGNVVLDTRQTDFAQNVPQVLWGASLPAHTVENVGTSVLRIISVELKRANSSSL